MKLVTLTREGELRLGVKAADGILDVKEALRSVRGFAADAPTDPMAAIRAGDAGIAALAQLLEACPASADAPYWVAEDRVEWGPCVPAPGKIICVGVNYRAHAAEMNLTPPETPVLFGKFANALNAHLRPVRGTHLTDQLDYEAELCVVIGRRASGVRESEALDYVFGYCCANDISARDLQNRTSQWLLGKTGDGFCPIGPYLVTADEVGDPQRLAIRSIVNGEVRQQADTGDMIFGCAELIAYISRYFTLEPGDIILTGTPSGVAMGLPGTPYLRAGDTVTVEIERLGALTNGIA
ncbi:MAG: 5-carboxymethyl-2-hydroxymuconate isomerase [Thermobacillus sp. ZCTH02-B1]|uniref:fumarylacetoacetate hydrolase family protein n=1 Tax=Thermobacillus sp. ZCTH02-B1 TaxID=1858795 RepID=UPI000B5798BF|nr:fumarylacetoacetate hydrolase family protein [Thermobacillus sp. ZCTH02-B1]OUM94197.1 MAG: 5-carboxymethyl-2-hydroxymuconate isomerase [Thermobacillus sp. ZCTH02-B1]